LIGFSRGGMWGRYANDVARSMGSFGRFNSRELGRVEPWHVDLVQLSQPMSLRDFDRAHPSTVPLEKVALLNNADVNTQLQPGTVKRVIGGVPGADLR